MAMEKAIQINSARDRNRKKITSIREEGSQKSARDAFWYRVKLRFFKRI